MRDSKKDELRRLLMKEMHPMEKLMRIGLGSLTVEGLPRGRYRLLKEKEVAELRKSAKPGNKDDLRFEEDKRVFTPKPQKTQWQQKTERPRRSGMPSKPEWPRRSHVPQKNEGAHGSQNRSQKPQRTGRDRKSPGGRPVPPRS